MKDRTAIKIPWQKSKSGNYLVWTSPSGNVRIQDTGHMGIRARFQVLARVGGEWLESADGPSLKSVWPVAQSDERSLARKVSKAVATELLSIAEDLVE